ncbi:MAG: DUF4340 domain-containing protein [Myxococcota bacterium]
MSARVPVVLGVIAAALFAFIVFVERDSLSSGQVRSEGARLVERFVRSRVDRIALRRAGEGEVVLVREREDDDLLGDWRLEAPMDADADDDAVSSLLGAVQWADARRRLGPLSDGDRAQFGLGEEALQAEFAVANETVALRLGGEAPGGGRYLEADGEGSVVGADLFEALDHGVGHFRSKRLFARGVLEADRVELEAFALERADERWRVPLEGADAPSVLGARGRVEELLRALTDLEAVRFSQGSLGEDAKVRARIHVPATGLDGEVPARDLVLREGGACPDEGAEPTERLVRVDDEAGPGEAACVLASDLELLDRAADAYRELRPATVSDLELERLVLRRGDDTLTVEQREGAWRYARTGGRADEGAVDDDALAEWLSSIRNARAEAFVPLGERTGSYGVEPPVAQLELVASDGRVEVVDVGAVSTEGLYLRRRLASDVDAEPVPERALLVVPADAEPLYALRTLHLRPRRIAEADAEALELLEVTRPGATERVSTEGAGFRVEAPVEVAAEASAVREAARQLAGLEAVRFVAEAPAPEHGLSPPQLVVVGTFGGGEDAKVVTLRLGLPGPGGTYASTTPEGAVFLVRPSVAEAFAQPFVDRDLLATDPLYLERLEVVGAGTSVVYRDDGSGLSASEGATPEDADPERVDALRSALEALRARRVIAFGPAAPADGLTPPRGSLRVLRDADGGEPREYTILIGGPTGEGDLVYVRREGLDVGFAYAAADLAPFLRAP